ncbi:FCGR2 protein, partial [Locustella ochotensis]|nr:FCGR2 protein [Locustella ochotensis]
GWCPLSPAGTQTTQLLVEPPCRPTVLWDRVTLTCQGLGTAGAPAGKRMGSNGGRTEMITVTESGTYKCERPSSVLSPPVMVLNDQMVLQVPAWPLLEEDTVTLRCQV